MDIFYESVFVLFAALLRYLQRSYQSYNMLAKVWCGSSVRILDKFSDLLLNRRDFTFLFELIFRARKIDRHHMVIVSGSLSAKFTNISAFFLMGSAVTRNQNTSDNRIAVSSDRFIFATPELIAIPNSLPTLFTKCQESHWTKSHCFRWRNVDKYFSVKNCDKSFFYD